MKTKYIVHGLGLSNNAAIRVLKKMKIDYDLVTQENQDNIEVLKDLKKIKTIIKAPGIPWNITLLEMAKKLQIPVITEINFGLSFWKINRPTIIGVTGTNGKSSFVKFLNDYLNFIGKKSAIGGNYGIPVCDLMLEYTNRNLDFLIVELSSFQTEIIPSMELDLAICLNISLSHMERYSSFDDYKNAKLNIKNHLKNDGQYLNSKSNQSKIPKDFYIQGTAGIESYSNLIQILEYFKITKDQIEDFSRHFESLPYRQQIIIKNENLLVINDSKSTNWDSTLSLIKTYQSEKSLHLIIGGKSRDKEVQISKEILSMIKEKNISLYLFGEVAIKLSEKLKDHQINSTILELTSIIKKLKLVSGIILFSPAFPSFDQFKNYVERGKFFTSEWKDSL